ncbi:MAG: sugar phosphate isomerase/epimerase [Candidatus Nealsonbacteria bacterium]|nr:sugar phosphate isomerase/epimerase [Candidatus Nealsonbacteria bacterium]
MNRRQNQTIDRRNFLAGVAGTAAAAIACPGLVCRAAEEKTPWKMRLSASTIGFTKLPIEKACQRIASLGFEAVDIWSAHAGCPHLDDALNRLGADGLMEVLKENKLKLYSFSVYSGGYPKYAELLGKVGGGVAVRGSAGAGDPKELTTRMKAFFEGLKPELELAEKYDSYLAIENHGGSLLSSLDSFKAFVDNNRNPRLGIAMAPYHLQGLKVSIEEAIAVCGKQLFYIYAWQRAPGTAQLPGIGPTDCTPWIAALAKADYQWYVNPFMHHEPEPDAMAEALAKSRDYLKQCYKKAVPG